MKKIILLVLFVLMGLSLVGCDRGWDYNVSVISTDDISLYDIDSLDEKQEIKQEISLFNNIYETEYKNIKFDDLDDNYHGRKGYYKFNYKTSKETIDLKIELIEADKYLLDFIRVAVKYEDELYIYKFYDEKEEIFDKENDPTLIKHFESKSLITDKLNLNVLKEELNELTIIYWIEEGENVTSTGEINNSYKKGIYKIKSMNLKISIS